MAAIALLAVFLGANVTSISAVVRLDFLSFKDAALIDALLQVLATPWHDDPDGEPYRRSPAPEEVVQQTVCGT